MSYRILSFDGGGVRGVYTAVLLERLSQQVPTMLTKVDLLAGTSTGGIIALGLAAGHLPAELVALYRDNASKIFDDSWLRDLADLHGLAGAEYDNNNLKQILTQIFATTRLEQLNKKVLVPSFQLDNQEQQAGKRMWKPKFFHNYPGPDSDGGELAVDVALRTSAASIYFPSYLHRWRRGSQCSQHGGPCPSARPWYRRPEAGGSPPVLAGHRPQSDIYRWA
jgi:patatin-like phospholipase/acyl hydrolase